MEEETTTMTFEKLRKKNLMAAVRKAENKIVAHKHPQKEAPSTS